MDGVSEQPQATNWAHDTSKNGMKRPWFLWAIAVADTIIGTAVGTTMLLYPDDDGLGDWKYEEGYVEAPLLSEFVMMMASMRVLVQMMMGMGLMWGLCKDDDSMTIFCLKEWIQGSYFIVCEQSFSLCNNITKLSEREMSEYVAWKKVGNVMGNSFDVMFRSLAFFVVSNYLTETTCEISPDAEATASQEYFA